MGGVVGPAIRTGKYCRILVCQRLQKLWWLQLGQMHQRWMETQTTMSRYCHLSVYFHFMQELEPLGIREMLSALNVTRYSKFSSVFPPDILWNLKNEIFTGIKIKYLSCPKLSPNVQMLRYNERPHSRVSNLIGCFKKSQITSEEKQKTKEFSPSLNLACSWTVTANVFIHCFVTLACKQTSWPVSF